jgi:hypothetical protein
LLCQEDSAAVDVIKNLSVKSNKQNAVLFVIDRSNRMLLRHVDLSVRAKDETPHKNSPKERKRIPIARN